MSVNDKTVPGAVCLLAGEALGYYCFIIAQDVAYQHKNWIIQNKYSLTHWLSSFLLVYISFCHFYFYIFKCLHLDFNVSTPFLYIYIFAIACEISLCVNNEVIIIILVLKIIFLHFTFSWHIREICHWNFMHIFAE